MIQARPASLPPPHRTKVGLAWVSVLSLMMGGLQAGCLRREPAAASMVPSAASAASSTSAAPSLPALPASVALALPAAAMAEATAAAQAAVAVAAPPATNPDVAPLPPAVVAFQQRRDACDHFRGEEPYDKQRAAFLQAQLAKTCKGTDKALAGLRQRFASNPNALAALQDYEDRIE